MVFTAIELRKSMDRRNNIRNISIIGHVSHGKSTLTDSLVAAVGITRADKADHGLSTKSTGISLLYEINNESLEAYKGERDGNEYLINLVDSPGHVEFSAEVTAALRITDGSMLIVDCIEGVCLQTETGLRQALGERVRPVLCLNKIDKLFPGIQAECVRPGFSGEHAYNILCNVIKNANNIMAANKDEQIGDIHFSPLNGTVAFSSGLNGWAFTLTDIAKKYASKHGTEESKFLERLWGDHFYNKTTKKWTRENTGPKDCVRGFVRLCYKPIKTIIGACISDDKAKLWRLCGKLGVRLSDDEKTLSGDALLKCVMQAWLPISTALLDMSILHLPSPYEAQKYRVDKLYEGPPDDSYAQAIRNCDPEGPLMVYVSKMIPSAEVGTFSAFGRVFSGRIRTGMKVRIMGPSYIPGMAKDLYVKPVQNTCIWMGRNQYDVQDIPCGSTVCMTGLEKFITKSATLTNEEEVDAWTFRAMKFCVSLVVYVTVECKVFADVPKLVEGLKRLAKSDPIVHCGAVNSRSCMVAGAGDLHLKICLNDLRGDFMDGSEIKISRPEILFCETIIGECGAQTIRSRNLLNSVIMAARPLDKELVQAIEDGLLGPRTDLMMRSKILAKSGWDEGLADKILCFGPGKFGPNMVVDMCKGGTNSDELRRIIVDCFQKASEEGALAKEKMRGIFFEIHQVVLNSVQKLRNENHQLRPMFKDAFDACQLRSKPVLLEPVFKVEIQAPKSALHTIHGLLGQNHSQVFETIEREGTQLITLRSFLHGSLLVGFAEAFQAATSGQVTPQCVLSHWDDMSSDPLKASSLSGQMVLDIRKAKEMDELSTVLKKLKL